MMAADSNVLALQRTVLAERCDDLLWNSIVLSAKALHRPESLRHSIESLSIGKAFNCEGKAK